MGIYPVDFPLSFPLFFQLQGNAHWVNRPCKIKFRLLPLVPVYFVKVLHNVLYLHNFTHAVCWCHAKQQAGKTKIIFYPTKNVLVCASLSTLMYSFLFLFPRYDPHSRIFWLLPVKLCYFFPSFFFSCFSLFL